MGVPSGIRNSRGHVMGPTAHTMSVSPGFRNSTRGRGGGWGEAPPLSLLWAVRTVLKILVGRVKRSPYTLTMSVEARNWRDDVMIGKSPSLN